MDLNFDFGDFLKKAMEEEMTEDNNDKDTDKHSAQAIDLLSGAKMMHLAKAAYKQKEILVNSLIKELSRMDKEDKAARNAQASVAIQTTAKKLYAMDAIISATTLCCMSPEESFDKVLKTVLGVMSII